MWKVLWEFLRPRPFNPAASDPPDRPLLSPFVEHMLKAPSCLDGFRTERTDAVHDGDTLRTQWQVACKCGSDTGRFLGYPLPGHDPSDGPVFLSPLAFECAQGHEIALLDTDRHGYHAAIGAGGAKRRAEGRRQALSCASCGGAAFRLAPAFTYWGIEELDEEFAEDPAIEATNLFSRFECPATCASCGVPTNPTDFGKL